LHLVDLLNPENIMTTRRNFIKKAAIGTAAASVGGVLPGFSAKSYNSIIGANDKIRMGRLAYQMEYHTHLQEIMNNRHVLLKGY
jgi:hypothetical protein